MIFLELALRVAQRSPDHSVGKRRRRYEVEHPVHPWPLGDGGDHEDEARDLGADEDLGPPPVRHRVKWREGSSPSTR